MWANCALSRLEAACPSCGCPCFLRRFGTRKKVYKHNSARLKACAKKKALLFTQCAAQQDRKDAPYLRCVALFLQRPKLSQNQLARAKETANCTE